MRQTPARSVRAIALVAAFFGLAVGCGHETFDLLAPGNAGSSGMAGQIAGGLGGAAAGSSGQAGSDTGGSGGVSGSGRAGGSGTGPCFPGQQCGNAGEGGASCPPTVFSCKRCEASKDCTEGDSPFCDLSSGRCIQCRPGTEDCEPFGVCNPFTRRCAAPCQAKGDCEFDHDYPLCDTAVGACVSCTMNSHCGEGSRRTCYLGLCVECDGSKASQCPLEKPYCVALRCSRKP